MHSLLRHRRLVVRFAALYGAGLAAFIVAWTLSYHFLPEGIMRGRTGAALLAGDEAADTFLLEFVRILVINAVVAVLLVFIPNRLLIVGRLPLGYWPPLVWAVMYGVTIGTNSFSIAEAGRLAPSLTVFGRSGLYEIAAYCLLAAATHGISLSRSPNIWTMRAEPVVPRPSLRDGVHWAGLAAAAVLLAAACAWEAYRIMARV